MAIRAAPRHAPPVVPPGTGRRRAPQPRTVLAVCLARRVHGVRRRDDRQHRLPGHRALVPGRRAISACPGSSTPTTSSSRRSWSRRAGSPTCIGRRRVFLVGLRVFTLASALCAIAPSRRHADRRSASCRRSGRRCWSRPRWRLVLQAFPADRRAHAVALLRAVGALAAGIGPSLGGLLVAADDWRLVFLVNVPVGIAAYVLSRRQLVESREPGRRRMPDLLGRARCFAVAVASLVLGVVQGRRVGLGEPAGAGRVRRRCRARRGLRLALRLAPLADRRPRRCCASARSRVANATTILAGAGFYGYTLVNVLFLPRSGSTRCSRRASRSRPGPFVAAAVAGPTSHLAERFGHRAVLVAGGLFWGAAVFWFVARVGITPEFVGEWLPGMVLLGIGAGTLFPNLSGAAVASAPGEGFATATGLNSVARQVGAALGVAIVIAIIGTPSPPEAASAFDNAWTFAAVCLARRRARLPRRRSAAARGRRPRTPSLGAPRARCWRTRRRRPSGRRSPSPGGRPRRRCRASRSRAPSRPPTSSARVPIFAPLSDADARRRSPTRARACSVAAGELAVPGGRRRRCALRRSRRAAWRSSARTTVGDARARPRRRARRARAAHRRCPRSASVRAARDSDLIAIGRDDFEKLLARGARGVDGADARRSAISFARASAPPGSCARCR